MKLAQRLVIQYLQAKLNLIAVFSQRKAARHAFELFSTPFRKNKKPAPPVFAHSEAVFLKTNAGRMKAYRWNHPSDRKVLILHGFESRAYNFDAYIKPLTKMGFEVIAIDAPAHGDSDGKRLILTDYIRAIKSAEDKFGPFEGMMGHSFGGLALGLYLEEYPEFYSRRIVLIAPATETTTAIDTFFRFLQLGKELRTAFDEHIRKISGKDAAYYSLKRALPHQTRHRFFWVHDEEDELTPWSDVIPLRDRDPEHIEFMVTRGLGHRRIYRDNKVRQEILAFLSGDQWGKNKEGNT
jgi:pimeloyl-ACP methyl ester carboxylesterase